MKGRFIHDLRFNLVLLLNREANRFGNRFNLQAPRIVAVAFLVLGLLTLVLGYRRSHSGALNFSVLSMDLYANVGVELISIAITVLLIDSFHELRNRQMRVIELMRRVREDSNQIALLALEELKRIGEVRIGGFVGIDLANSKLSRAILSRASLDEINCMTNLLS